jgi:hypothetical protein
MRKVTYICDNCLKEYEPSEIEGILTVAVSRADARVDIFTFNKRIDFIPEGGYLHFCNENCVAEYIKKLLHPM